MDGRGVQLLMGRVSVFQEIAEIVRCGWFPSRAVRE